MLLRFCDSCLQPAVVVICSEVPIYSIHICMKMMESIVQNEKNNNNQRFQYCHRCSNVDALHRNKPMSQVIISCHSYNIGNTYQNFCSIPVVDFNHTPRMSLMDGIVPRLLIIPGDRKINTYWNCLCRYWKPLEAN